MKRLICIIALTLGMISCSMYETILTKVDVHENIAEVVEGYNPIVSVCTKDTMSLMDVLGIPNVQVIGCVATLDDGRVVYPEISDYVQERGLTAYGIKLFKKPLNVDNAKVEILYTMYNNSYVKVDSVDDIRIMLDIAIPITFNVTIDGWQESDSNITL